MLVTSETCIPFQMNDMDLVCPSCKTLHCIKFSMYICSAMVQQRVKHFNLQCLAFKAQVSAVVRSLFSSNANYGTMFSLLDINGVHLIGWLCPVDPLMSEFNHVFFTRAAVHKFSNFFSIRNSLVGQTVATRRLYWL